MKYATTLAAGLLATATISCASQPGLFDKFQNKFGLNKGEYSIQCPDREYSADQRVLETMVTPLAGVQTKMGEPNGDSRFKGFVSPFAAMIYPMDNGTCVITYRNGGPESISKETMCKTLDGIDANNDGQISSAEGEFTLNRVCERLQENKRG